MPHLLSVQMVSITSVNLRLYPIRTEILALFRTVGVAMGLNGSDVAKQSAEIVLSDDNFSTIIEAIRKGRGIYFNLQKFLLYLLSGNLAEVLVMMIGLAFIDQNGESTFPISPVGALWINTLAAGPPALALGLEPTPDDAMERGPKDFQVMFTKWWFIDLVYYGFLMAGLALANFAITIWGYYNGYLGYDCNEGLNDTICHNTGQARGACFSAFLIVLMGRHHWICLAHRASY
jgi:Na+-exporting ATPase